ncbi:hypothetical protein [Ramlibacter montanisoli]|uniref:Uncharacterized protein n=1 Tax=Ramlibacter montanisoli TaxID=2732512 RepID=A0A849KCF7_9BURK|nr:hypothetical protein [Ramlibacter montanisoli]NNU43176.1 hypothetical protein [Ramlibacter montanisoli]
MTNSAKATGKQSGGGSIGVGASIAINVGETDTDALLGVDATLSGANDVTLEATSRNDMTTTAEGGSAGETAVTPVIAVTVSSNETIAKLGSLDPLIAATTTVGDDLDVKARHIGSVETKAEGDTESGDTGVGISLALSIGSDFAEASTARNLSAGGLVAFNGRSVSSTSSNAKASVAGGDDEEPAEGSPDATEGGVNKQVKDNRNAANSKASANGSDSPAQSTDGASAEGEGGSKVQVAGAVAITIQSSTARAKIDDGLVIVAGTSSTDGVLTLKSENNAGAEAIADASTTMEGEGADGGTGVGVAVSVNVANVVNEAILGDSTVTADGVVVQALVPADGGDQVHGFKAEATSGASGAGTGVAGALAINVGISRSQAKIADNATLTLTGTVADRDVSLSAENFVSNTVKAGAKQEGGSDIGVGASIAVNVGETDTDAVVGSNVLISGANDLTMVASSKSAMATEAEGGSAGDTAITAVVAVSVADNDTRAELWRAARSRSAAASMPTHRTKARSSPTPRATPSPATRGWASRSPSPSAPTPPSPPPAATSRPRATCSSAPAPSPPTAPPPVRASPAANRKKSPPRANRRRKPPTRRSASRKTSPTAAPARTAGRPTAAPTRPTPPARTRPAAPSASRARWPSQWPLPPRGRPCPNSGPSSRTATMMARARSS